MKLLDFKLLSTTEQLDLLYEQGVYLGKRNSGPYKTVLYQLDQFYVEIFYKKYRQYVYRIYSFQSIENLEPYLEAINISELLKEQKI